MGLRLGQLARGWALVAKVWDWPAETAVGLAYSLCRVCLRSETRTVSLGERVTSFDFVCLPVLAVLDALSQRGSLV